MYFANNEGLLVFDGVAWHLYRMPNSSITRSVYIDDNQDIYVGAYNEMGKMEYRSNGKLEFKSLKKYLPSEYQNFDDIWNITTFEGKIVFQSYASAFILGNDTSFTVIKAPFRFQNSFKVRKRLYFNDIENGLYELIRGNLVALAGTQSLKGEDIVSVLPFGISDELLVFTQKKGVFLYNGKQLVEWKVPVNELLKKKTDFQYIFYSGPLLCHWNNTGWYYNY